MSFEVERVIGKQHPAIAGHFPGNPLVPGVLILDEVLQAMHEWRADVRLKSFASVKFSALLRPGESFRIVLSESGQTEIAFECRRNGTTLASGKVIVHSGANGK